MKILRPRPAAPADCQLRLENRLNRSPFAISSRAPASLVKVALHRSAKCRRLVLLSASFTDPELSRVYGAASRAPPASWRISDALHPVDRGPSRPRPPDDGPCRVERAGRAPAGG